jgi:hypothetical protein
MHSQAEIDNPTKEDGFLYDEPPSSDDLREKMRGCGWIIEVIEREDDRDNDYIDCVYYNDTRREEESEEEEWLKEYYRRRDLYWKNDSDYD